MGSTRRWIATAAISALCVAGANGQTLKNVTHGNQPLWWPDGSKIMFSDGSNLYVITRDASSDRRLVSVGSGSTEPRWTASGHKSVFTEFPPPPYSIYPDLDLYVMDVDGQNRKRLTSVGLL